MENLRSQETVSIIIPCYNQGEYLHEAIISALSQTHAPHEVIVVNDGSTDNTIEVAKKYPITLINQHNQGLSATRNNGIKASTGKWILPLDADDKIAPTFLEKTIGKSDIISTDMQEFGLKSGTWVCPVDYPDHYRFKMRNQIFCCSLYKREMFDKIGGYDENMKEGFEDWEFWVRATGKGYNVRVIREFLFFYRKRGDSMLTESMKKYHELYSYIREKHKY